MFLLFLFSSIVVLYSGRPTAVDANLMLDRILIARFQSKEDFRYKTVGGFLWATTHKEMCPKGNENGWFEGAARAIYNTASSLVYHMVSWVLIRSLILRSEVDSEVAFRIYVIYGSGAVIGLRYLIVFYFQCCVFTGSVWRRALTP